MPAKVRIHGIDLARAIAVLGMISAHLSSAEGETAPGQLMISVTDSLPSALFAVLAGVSLSLMGTGPAREGGQALATNRHRLLVRGLVVIGIGVVLLITQMSILVVLIPLGAAMILLVPAIRARTSTLVTLAVSFLLAGPAAQVLFPGAMEQSSLFGGSYPLLAWLGYVTIGILLHRLLIPASVVAQVVVLVTGTVGTFFGIWLRDVLGMLGTDPAGTAQTYSSDPVALNTAPVLLDPAAYTFLSPEGHSGGLVDQLACIAASLAVIAASLLLTRSAAITRVLYPLRATGSMGLSVYVIHVVTASMVMGGFTGGMIPYEIIVEDYVFGAAYPVALAITIVVAIVAASLWKLQFRRGPLETVVNRLIDSAASREIPALVTRTPGTVDTSVR